MTFPERLNAPVLIDNGLCQSFFFVKEYEISSADNCFVAHNWPKVSVPLKRMNS
jgi:hypothetical protein